MRVFIYEFVTGGGWEADQPLGGSLLAEGQAMSFALTTDFAELEGATVATTRDCRVAPFHAAKCEVESIGSSGHDRQAIERLAAAADVTLLIAPESGGALLERCQWVRSAGGRLISPGPDVIALTSDKHATCEHLHAAGIQVPIGGMLTAAEFAAQTPPQWATFPAVRKPLDGCGSQGVRTLNHWEDRRCAGSIAGPHRLEQQVAGLPASVAVLCGPDLLLPLPACEQRLSDDGRFSYLGGRTPLAPALDCRARSLALAAVRTLPEPLGYLGVDLVLGSATDGSADYVIEINPRLTTSYVGLRAACRANLAAAMLAVARGQRPALSWHRGEVQFSADGSVDTSKANTFSEFMR